MESRGHFLGTTQLLGTESGGCVAVNSQGKVTESDWCSRSFQAIVKVWLGE